MPFDSKERIMLLTVSVDDQDDQVLLCDSVELLIMYPTSKNSISKPDLAQYFLIEYIMASIRYFC